MSGNDNNKSTDNVEAENLAKNWSTLSRFEQGQRIKELVASGRSMRQLAKIIGRSEATVRKRVDLANLSPAERAAFGKPLQNSRVPLSRADPHKVIKRCKPKGGMGNTAPDHTNFFMKWFENWASGLIPQWTLRYAVLNRAIQLLEEEIRNPSHG